MKKNGRKIKAALILAGTGASSILGQTSSNVHAGPTSAGTNASSVLGQDASNAHTEIIPARVLEQDASNVPAESMRKKVFDFLYKSPVEKMVGILTFSVILPVLYAGTGIASLAYAATTKFVHILRRATTAAHGVTINLVHKLNKVTSRAAIDKKYNLKSFKEMIKKSNEKRKEEEEEYNDSEEKRFRDLYIYHRIKYKNNHIKTKRKSNPIKQDEEFLQQLFEKYSIDYKSNKGKFNRAFEQLSILFYNINNLEGKALLDEYANTLNYVGSDANSLNKQDSLEERFNKIGVIELLYDWSKGNKNLDEDLKEEIQKIHKSIKDHYDYCQNKYKELEKLYEGASNKLEKGWIKLTVKKESFLKEKFKNFTQASYDLDYLIKILKDSEKYPTLIKEFKENIEKSGIKYYKEFDVLILDLLEITKEQMQGTESREKYFKFIDDVKKIKNDKDKKNGFSSLLNKLEENFTLDEGRVYVNGIIFNFCDGDSNFNFLCTIDIAIPHVSESKVDIEQINRIYKDRYSEEDIREILSKADELDFENYKMMSNIIISEMNDIKTQDLPFTIEHLKKQSFMKFSREQEEVTPQKILSLLSKGEKSKVNVRVLEKFLGWCKNYATEDLRKKMEKIYVNKEFSIEDYTNEEKLKKVLNNVDEYKFISFFNFLKQGGSFADCQKAEKIYVGLNFGINEDYNDTKKIKNILEKLNIDDAWRFLKFCMHTGKSPEYCDLVEKIYVKKMWGIEKDHTKKENLTEIFMELAEYYRFSFFEFLEKMSYPEDYIEEARQIKKELSYIGHTLSFKDKKYTVDQFLKILKNEHDFPKLYKRVVNQSKQLQDVPNFSSLKSKIIQWLESGGLEGSNLDGTSRSIISYFVDDKDLQHNANLAKERKKIGVKRGQKYSKEQFVSLLQNKEEFPSLYEQIKEYATKKQGYYGVNYYRNFSSIMSYFFSYGEKDLFEENLKPLLIGWLNDESLKRTEIHENEDVSKLLLDIIYEFVDNDYLKNRSTNNSNPHKD